MPIKTLGSLGKIRVGRVTGNTHIFFFGLMCIQTLVSFCQFVLKILSKNRILTSIKGRNSVANLRKTTIYNTKVDLVSDNVYTKFGLNRSICF